MDLNSVYWFCFLLANWCVYNTCDAKRKPIHNGAVFCLRSIYLFISSKCVILYVSIELHALYIFHWKISQLISLIRSCYIYWNHRWIENNEILRFHLLHVCTFNDDDDEKTKKQPQFVAHVTFFRLLAESCDNIFIDS